MAEEITPSLTLLAGVPGVSHPLSVGAMVVGRSPDANLQLKHPEVSRQHCRFHWDGRGICTVEDLGSRWGTSINGTALASGMSGPLKSGDLVQIGPVLVHYGFGPPSAGLAEALAADSSLAPGSPTVLIGGKEVSRILLGDKVVTLGRTNDAAVVLVDASISRQHAIITRTPGGYEVADQHSRAGSLVNGRRFEKHLLVIGDQLQMGPFFFRFDGRALVRVAGLAGNRDRGAASP